MTCSAAEGGSRRRRWGRVALAATTAVLALAVTALPAAAKKKKNKPPTELINLHLGPEYSQWLVGPISRLIGPSEMDAYLALTDDAAAQRFIEEFWAGLDPDPDRPGNAIREAFDKRAAEADKLYSEAGYLGRRTDRGTIYVLFGPPDKTDYEISPDPKDPPIETWEYPSDAPAGLSGEHPARLYRFIKRGDITVFYTPSSLTLGRTRIEDF